MPVLSVQDLVVQFPAVRALDGITLDFLPGEVHGIIGENGAGKSTLMRCLAGLQAPTSGQILLKGQPAQLQSARQASEAGIAMIHQELNLVDTLSVAANIFLGNEPMRWMALDESMMESEAKKLLDRVGATFSPRDRVGDLSLAERQLVEIAKALGQDAQVLIMDEPTAVLSEAETNTLFRLVGELKQSGVCVLYISHRLVELDILCDRISILRDGQWVGTFPRAELSQSELANKMVGRELSEVFPPRNTQIADHPLLEARNISDGSRVRSATFSIRAGEVVGLAGLMGAGRTEIGQMLAGHRPIRDGVLHWKGSPVEGHSASRAKKLGIVYVSEDRKAIGLHTSLNVVENTVMANLGKYSSVWIQEEKLEQTAIHWIRELDIRVGDPSSPVRLLSGGNQQKVSVAKWLDTQPNLLVLDEPTRGVDVGAKGELYRLIAHWSASGLACLIISSELPELLGLCHRILVVRDGAIVGEFAGESATETGIMQLAAGATV